MTARKSVGGRRPQVGVRGFTLIEILMATLLSATLLLATWSLFSIYTDLFETGLSKTEQSQLARALIQQLSDDLHAAIQDPQPGIPKKPLGPVPVRRFGLFGSQHELRLDILQVTPLQGNPTPVTDTEGMLQEAQPPRIPELRTVYYAFRLPLAAGEAEESAGAEDLPGLTRRELDFETPYQEQETSLGDRAVGTSALDELIAEDADPADRPSAESPTPDLVDESIMWVPEVTRLEFRYFDGSGWTGQWNSLERKSLPVAVEVVIQMGTLEERAEQEAIEVDLELEEEISQEAAPEAPGPVYRLVVDLPASPTHPAPKGVRPVETLPPPVPLVRRIAPPPRPLPTVPPPEIQRAPDEWIRRGP